MFVEWLLVIYLTRVAYRISKRKFKPVIAAIIAGITGIVAVFVSANVIGALLTEQFEIRYIFHNLLFMALPWLAL